MSTLLNRSFMRVVSMGIVPLLLLAVLAATACSDDEAEGAFQIGVMESVTGPGETYGTVAVQAKQLAVEEINAAGGINGADAGVDSRRLQVQRAGRYHRV